MQINTRSPSTQQINQSNSGNALHHGPSANRNKNNMINEVKNFSKINLKDTNEAVSFIRELEDIFIDFNQCRLPCTTGAYV
jgi:hypothetical protein